MKQVLGRLEDALTTHGRWRVLEWFAGIGGAHAAWPEAEFLGAIDINLVAAQIYQQNFSTPYLIREIESIELEELQRWQADAWWLSPPCQPFSRRGNQLGLNDPRCGAFRHLLQLLNRCQPHAVVLENVEGFADSDAYNRLVELLTENGYAILQRSLCPTELGWPNRRPRFYLLAARGQLEPWRPLPNYSAVSCLRNLISSTLLTEDAIMLPAAQLDRFGSALDRIDASLEKEISACFTASYGKMLKHSGSYVACGDGYRWFTPREVANLLGFPADFRLEQIPRRGLWKLLGNSLSLPAVRYVLSHLPHGPSAHLPWFTGLECQPATSQRWAQTSALEAQNTGLRRFR